jgi:hypothetical protein
VDITLERPVPEPSPRSAMEVNDTLRLKAESTLRGLA